MKTYQCARHKRCARPKQLILKQKCISINQRCVDVMQNKTKKTITKSSYRIEYFSLEDPYSVTHLKHTNNKSTHGKADFKNPIM